MKVMAEILCDKGLKVTPQRLAVYQALAGTREHPSAEAIYEKVRQDHPTISFNTVDKILQALEEAGLIRRLSAAENVFRYDADVKPHGHIVCLKCNRVDDLHEPFGHYLEELRKMARDISKYDIRYQDLYFYGYCPDCLGKVK